MSIANNPLKRLPKTNEWMISLKYHPKATLKNLQNWQKRKFKKARKVKGKREIQRKNLIANRLKERERKEVKKVKRSQLDQNQKELRKKKQKRKILKLLKLKGNHHQHPKQEIKHSQKSQKSNHQ